MLRREKGKQGTFADQARAAQAVPEDHILMRMKRAADWNAVDAALERYYSNKAEGRPGWPPSVLVRMMLIEQYADLSDREAREQVGYNLLYRGFVGLGADEEVPDDTTLVRFRARIGAQGAREVFEALNRQWEAAGLISKKRRVLDGVHFWAKVARRSWVSLMREGRALVVEAVENADAARGAKLRGEFIVAMGAAEARGEEALKIERERTLKLLEAVADVSDERVRERARILAAMLKEEDRPVSFDDPDARWGHKSKDKPFLGYKAHESMDPESRMITGVDVVPGNANEAVRTDDLLAKDPTPPEPGAAIIADALYNNATTVGQVEAARGRACFSGLNCERVSDGFEYDAAMDQAVCREGKRSIGKTRMAGKGDLGHGDLYYFSVRDCSVCPRRGECLTPGEREGTAMARRRVYFSDVRKRKIAAGETGRAWRREQLKVRYRIEAKFDEQMNRHGLRRARYWGLAKVTLQVLLNALTVNAKRAMTLLARAVAEVRA
jgi:IS5 family transposase